MQFQIKKDGIINKFPAITDIKSAVAPYLSFNNEYFLNLELSQEADSNFKINNKFYKVNGSNVTPILNAWRYENPGVNDDENFDCPVTVMTDNRLSRTGTAIACSNPYDFGYIDVRIPDEQFPLTELWAKCDFCVCGYGDDDPAPKVRLYTEDGTPVEISGRYCNVGLFFVRNGDPNDEYSMNISFPLNNPNTAEVTCYRGESLTNIRNDIYSDPNNYDYQETLSLSTLSIHSIKFHIRRGNPNGVIEAYLDNDSTPFYSYTGDVDFGWNDVGTMNINSSGVAISNIIISTAEVHLNEVLQWTNTNKKNVKSIQSITKSVDYGTTFENIGLPNAIVATLDDDTTVDLPVTWNTASYISTQAGSQNVIGTIVLTDNLTNTNNLTATAIVTVAEQIIDPVNSDDWSLQFTLGTVESEVLLSNIPGFSEKDTPADTDFYGEDYDNQGRHLEIRYLGTQGNLTYAPDGVPVPNSCSSEEEQAAAINPDGYADYDPEAGNIMFSGGSAGTKVYMLVYHSEPFNS